MQKQIKINELSFNQASETQYEDQFSYFSLFSNNYIIKIQNQVKQGQIDPRKPVQQSHKKYPYNTIGKILAYFQHEQQPFQGTAFYIGNYVIATAAHNVCNYDNIMAKQIYFYPAQQLSSRPIKIKAKQFKIHEKYHRQKKQSILFGSNIYDIALIQLQQNQSYKQRIQPLKIKWNFKLEDHKNSNILLAGYPNQYNKNSDVCILYEDIKKCHNQDQFYLYYKHTTTGGQSGMPIIEKIEQNQFNLIGLHKAGIFYIQKDHRHKIAHKKQQFEFKNTAKCKSTNYGLTFDNKLNLQEVLSQIAQKMKIQSLLGENYRPSYKRLSQENNKLKQMNQRLTELNSQNQHLIQMNIKLKNQNQKYIKKIKQSLQEKKKYQNKYFELQKQIKNLKIRNYQLNLQLINKKQQKQNNNSKIAPQNKNNSFFSFFFSKSQTEKLQSTTNKSEMQQKIQIPSQLLLKHQHLHKQIKQLHNEQKNQKKQLSKLLFLQQPQSIIDKKITILDEYTFSSNNKYLIIGNNNKNIQKIDLIRFQKIQAFEIRTQMLNLTHVYLRYNKISSIDQFFSQQLPKLQIVNFQRNRIKQIKQLPLRFYSLRILFLGYNQISDTSFLTNHRNLQLLNLETLGLSNNKIQQLKQININCHQLYLRDNIIHSIDNLQKSTINNLKILYLNGNNITKLCKFSNLSTINLLYLDDGTFNKQHNKIVQYQRFLNDKQFPSNLHTFYVYFQVKQNQVKRLKQLIQNKKKLKHDTKYWIYQIN